MKILTVLSLKEITDFVAQKLYDENIATMSDIDLNLNKIWFAVNNPISISKTINQLYTDQVKINMKREEKYRKKLEKEGKK